jgi:hypothetical protein
MNNTYQNQIKYKYDNNIIFTNFMLFKLCMFVMD